jgi:hypothetical protein
MVDELAELLHDVEVEADNQNDAVIQWALNELSYFDRGDEARIRKELLDSLPPTCDAMRVHRKWVRCKQRLKYMEQPNYTVSPKRATKRCGCEACHRGPIKPWVHQEETRQLIAAYEAEMKRLTPCRQCLACAAVLDKNRNVFLDKLRETIQERSQGARQELGKLLLSLASEG